MSFYCSYCFCTACLPVCLCIAPTVCLSGLLSVCLTLFYPPAHYICRSAPAFIIGYQFANRFIHFCLCPTQAARILYVERSAGHLPHPLFLHPSPFLLLLSSLPLYLSVYISLALALSIYGSVLSIYVPVCLFLLIPLFFLPTPHSLPSAVHLQCDRCVTTCLL